MLALKHVAAIIIEQYNEIVNQVCFCLTRVECMYLSNTTLFDGRDMYNITT